MVEMRTAWLFLTATVILCHPAPALACACCPEAGQRSVGEQKLEGYEAEVLEQLRFGPRAKLLTGQRGSGELPGMLHPADSYAVESTWAKDALRLALRTEKAGGKLNLRLPSRFTRFAVDIHDDKRFAGGGPLLYKEWRLEGPVSQEGLFAPGKAPTRYSLVFQGRGGNCDEADQFTHWHLRLTGGSTDYELSGTLRPR